MRTIIYLILTFLSTLTYSQVIDWENFDTKLIDSLVLQEANIYRKSNSKLELVNSPVLHGNISIRQTQLQLKEQKMFHPYVDTLFHRIEDSLIIESENRNPGKKNLYKSFTFAELCIRTHRQDDKFTTYQELAKYLIKLWISSPAHQSFLLNWATLGEHKYGIGATSIQVGDYYWGGRTFIGIYASLHICGTYIN